MTPGSETLGHHQTTGPMDLGQPAPTSDERWVLGHRLRLFHRAHDVYRHSHPEMGEQLLPLVQNSPGAHSGLAAELPTQKSLT